MSFSWLYLDYSHTNENCLPHISSTCWRDDVGVTKPHSSNRASWSLWFAFLGWLLTPVWGLWLLSWETPGSWCRVFQREEEEGNLGCTATLCCRKRFPASGAAVENDDWAPPHCYKPPLYCGWGKLNAVSQAFNYAVRPLPLNNILYFLPSHCILPDIFVLYLAYIHLTSSIQYLLRLNEQQWVFDLLHDLLSFFTERHLFNHSQLLFCLIFFYEEPVVKHWGQKRFTNSVAFSYRLLICPKKTCS